MQYNKNKNKQKSDTLVCTWTMNLSFSGWNISHRFVKSTF